MQVSVWQNYYSYRQLHWMFPRAQSSLTLNRRRRIITWKTWWLTGSCVQKGETCRRSMLLLALLQSGLYDGASREKPLFSSRCFPCEAGFQRLQGLGAPGGAWRSVLRVYTKSVALTLHQLPPSRTGWPHRCTIYPSGTISSCLVSQQERGDLLGVSVIHLDHQPSWSPASETELCYVWTYRLGMLICGALMMIDFILTNSFTTRALRHRRNLLNRLLITKLTSAHSLTKTIVHS